MKKILGSLIFIVIVLGLLFLFNLERFLVLAVGIIGGILLLLLISSIITGRDKRKAKKFMGTGRELAEKGDWEKAAGMFKSAIYASADSPDLRDSLESELEELYKSQSQEANFILLNKALRKSVSLAKKIRNQLNTLPGEKVDKNLS